MMSAVNMPGAGVGAAGAGATATDELFFLTADEINARVLSGDLTARQVADAFLARIDAVDPELHIFNQVTPELARTAADAIDAAIAGGADADELGPLAGVPVAFKDNMNLLGTRTTCSSRILENYESVYDCTAVRRLLDAHTIPLGKLNMDEFAFGSSTENSAFGPTKNPWDPTRVPGGSSGGSGACVAAGLATITLGSDTGGSIRQPGCFTGTVALKPTYGRVSRYGCVAFASSLDQIGPFAHTVRDAAYTLNAICGHDPHDATSVDAPAQDFAAACDLDPAGLRVAIATDMLERAGLDPRIKQGVLDAAEMLSRAGAEIVEVTLPSTDYGLSAYYIVGPAEASSNLARFDGIRYGVRATDADDVMDLYFRSRAQGFGPETIRRIMIGTYALSAGYYDAYYGQAQKARTVIKGDYDRVFAQADVLLTPTSPTTAFAIGEKSSDPLEMYLSDIFTIPINLAGVAGMSVPTTLIDGLPSSVQVICGHFNERQLFRAAAALERALDFPYASVPVATGTAGN
ncbi:MAG: Asp-tRNA(Asn)/Glu-tRNA(Gln) amidotransferase subunit GatA [Actinomycetes bacterium]|jgi:aspartyl-tRNA(Asn)/glutamyl-tRNA(Gln) amidotransferase subunit A|nr:Asp-tRNA(Asn)/Glu-tRNA(Gln) amidotransferase subunit GatA [Actinomycetes bacterium]